MIVIVSIVFVLAAAWLLLLMPRRNHPGWEKLAGYRYAHRGLHNAEKGVPENSMTAFRLAVEHGLGAELDVHLLADGNLAVFHDKTLKRVCGADVEIEDLTAEQLKNYSLLGTEEHIPLFEEVLELFEGKTPLIVELKMERGNTAALTDAVMQRLADWQGNYCVECFHPAVVRYLKQEYPHAIRGQLSENFLGGKTLSGFAAFLMTFLLSTAFTRPDFIAYRWKDRKNISLRLMKALYGVHEVSWTVEDAETMKRLEADGCAVIFEKFIP